MGHLLSTSQRVAREEESAKAYSEYSAGAGREPVASDGWQPAGPQLMAEPSQDEVDGQGIPGGIQYVDAQLGVADRPPLPEVGHWVLFHLRAGDARNRRTKFPALVMDVDHERRQLELMVVVDASDTWMQERVRERVEPEQGWERIKPDTLIEVSVQQLAATVDLMRNQMEILDRAIQVRVVTPEIIARLEAIENHPALEVPALATSEERTTTTTRQRRKRG